MDVSAKVAVDDVRQNKCFKTGEMIGDEQHRTWCDVGDAFDADGTAHHRFDQPQRHARGLARHAGVARRLFLFSTQRLMQVGAESRPGVFKRRGIGIRAEGG